MPMVESLFTRVIDELIECKAEYIRREEANILTGTERDRVERFLATLFNGLSDVEDKASTCDLELQTLVDSVGEVQGKVEKLEEQITNLKDSVEGFGWQGGDDNIVGE